MRIRNVINNRIAFIKAELTLQRAECVLGGHDQLILNHITVLLQTEFPGNVILNKRICQVMIWRIDSILAVSVHPPKFLLALRAYFLIWQGGYESAELFFKAEEHWNSYLQSYRTRKADTGYRGAGEPPEVLPAPMSPAQEAFLGIARQTDEAEAYLKS